MTAVAPQPGAVQIGEASRPQLPRHIRLQRDEARQRWVIQAPERVLVPDETAVEILQMTDGTTTVAAMVDRLAAKYQAPRSTIAADVVALLQDLADQGYLIDRRGSPP
jgi:pyrroloquinoline quinone biosynthesis protein D